MNGRKLQVMRYLSLALFLITLAVCAPFISWGDLALAHTFGLIAFIACFETWRIYYPWGRPLQLGMAATLCVIAIRPMPEAVWVFAVGSLVGLLINRLRERGEGEFFHVAQRTLIVALSGLVYQLIVNIGRDFTWKAYPAQMSFLPLVEPGRAPEYSTYYNPAVLNRALVFCVAFAVAALVYYLGETLTSSLEAGMEERGNWRLILPQHMRQTLPAYLAITGAGALMALYFPRIPWLNFLVFFLPLLLVRMECNRDKELDERYFQTMRVIGGAFDLDRGVPGHSERVSNLAAEVAREMGVSGEEIRDIRYAAAVHDIGRIDFDPGDEEAPGHSEMGAEVLEGIPRLRPIAHIVRHCHPSGEEAAGTARVPVGSKIIGVVSDYDMLVNNPAKKMSSAEALEEMGLERGKLYDSIVMRTLSQVVEARSRMRRRPEREISQRAKVLEEEEMRESLEEIFREEEQER